MTEGGKKPVVVIGESRTFIQDGDEIALFAEAQGDGYCTGFGSCTGTVTPAQP